MERRKLLGKLKTKQQQKKNLPPIRHCICLILTLGMICIHLQNRGTETPPLSPASYSPCETGDFLTAGREIPDSGPSPGLYADYSSFWSMVLLFVCFPFFQCCIQVSTGKHSGLGKPWAIIRRGLDKPLGSTENTCRETVATTAHTALGAGPQPTLGFASLSPHISRESGLLVCCFLVCVA